MSACCVGRHAIILHTSAGKEPDCLHAMLQAAAEQIHGLGPGGNVPSADRHSGPSPHGGWPNREEHQATLLRPPGGEHHPVSGVQEQGPAGRGADRPGQRAPGRGRSNFAAKEKHKAAVANHHRKDRALRKFAGPLA